MTVYNQQAYFESVSTVTATPSVEVGTWRREGNDEYVYCYNIGSSTIGAHYGVTVSGLVGYSVTVSTITSVDMMIGICKHTDIPTGSYGWILTKGFSQFAAGADNSFAAGGPLICGVDGTFALKSSATLHTGSVVGKAMSAVASGGSGYAFFKF